MLRFYIITLILIFLIKDSKSQTGLDKFKAYEKEISKVLNTNSRAIRADSVYIYAFNFQVEVLFDKLGKTSVQKVSVNDS